jgi:hypothetical protein
LEDHARVFNPRGFEDADLGEEREDVLKVARNVACDKPDRVVAERMRSRSKSLPEVRDGVSEATGERE